MRRRPALAPVVTIGIALLLLSLPQSSEAKQPGAVLWEDEFGIVEIAASDGLVAAVGTIPNGAGGRTSVVRVYAAANGKLLWQQTVSAEFVVIDGSTVVVAGAGAVRAFDAKQGRLKWSDSPPFAVTQLYRDEDTTLAAAMSDDGTSIRIRAYHTKRGTVLVGDRVLSLGGPFFTVTTFSRGKMFTGTVGQAELDGFPVHPCKVTAHSITTGEVLWETTQPVAPPSPTTYFCTPLVIRADRERVILGGAGHFGDEFMAQAYDANTGAFLWEHLSGIGTCCFDAVVAIDVEKQSVFAAGWTANPFSQSSASVDFVIHALSLDTGLLRWEARSPGADCSAPFGRCFAHARLVVADSDTVYGAGFNGEPSIPIPGSGFLRAYNAKTGELRWQDDDVDVEAIAATTGTVVVLTPGAGPNDVILRAYDGK